MAAFNGFSLSHVCDKITSETIVSTDCMTINFENTGEQTLKLSLKDSPISYTLQPSESISFPDVTLIHY